MVLAFGYLIALIQQQRLHLRLKMLMNAEQIRIEKTLLLYMEVHLAGDTQENNRSQTGYPESWLKFNRYFPPKQVPS
jgi:hypothetical protein